MLKKRLIAGMAACLMVVSAFSVSASTYAWTDTIRVYKNQGAYLTNACVKLNTQNYFKVNIQPDKNVSDAWSQGTELIYARARDVNNNYASSLVETRYAGNFTPKYYSGYGVFSYSYKCAAQYADSNPHQYAALTLNWEP